jgi:hypothetical protein
VREQTSVLYEATNLATPAALAGAIAQMREYFNEHHLAQPPLPHDVLELVPCSLRTTETQTNAGKVGRLIIARPDGVVLYEPDGVVLYESEWTISPA